MPLRQETFMSSKHYYLPSHHRSSSAHTILNTTLLRTACDSRPSHLHELPHATGAPGSSCGTFGVLQRLKCRTQVRWWTRVCSNLLRKYMHPVFILTRIPQLNSMTKRLQYKPSALNLPLSMWHMAPHHLTDITEKGDSGYCYCQRY